MKVQSLMTIAILCLTVNAFSQIQFTTHIVTPGAGTTDNATYVLAVDVDNDGYMDIVSSSFLDNKIAWYENDSNQNFTQHIIYTNAKGASWLAAADMDGDQDIDVLSTALVDDRIYWYENDGIGNFTTHVVDSVANPTGWGKFSVFAYDVDGDNDMDVLSGSWDQTEVEWHENDGNQNFSTHIVDTIGERSHVIAKDMDGDGDADIVASSQIPNTIAWYENDGNQNFTSYLISDSAFGVRTVIARDMDKDGDVDVVAGLYDSNVEWYENDGNQNFTTHRITTGLSNTNVIYIVDLDNDGDNDIITGSAYLNTISWLENVGDENFMLHIITNNTGDWPSAVWGADVDSDGDIDVLSSSLYGDEIAWYENNLIYTGIEPKESATPEKFVLYQNYPNPFNPATTIEFTLPQSGFVTLTVYNILGEEVATLLNAHKPAGQYAVNFDASKLTSGVYYYTLRVDGFKESHKMVLLR